jgi:hypothetical protein
MTITGRPTSFESDRSRRQPRFGGMIGSKVGYVIATLVGIILLIMAARFVYHTRIETFFLTYFPGNNYAAARDLPTFDERGEPRIVLVRTAGHIECFDVYYSLGLWNLLQANPSSRVRVTYRVRYRFGHPFWIETLDVAGLGVEPTTSRFSMRGSRREGNVSPAECF